MLLTTSTRSYRASTSLAICTSLFLLSISSQSLTLHHRAENLIAYTFNNLSYSSNSYMQALSVLSVIFLPLTFLSVSLFSSSSMEARWLTFTRS